MASWRRASSGWSGRASRSAAISANPALQARVNRYLTILHRFSVAFVYVLIALVIMQIWGINLIGWAGATLKTAFRAQIVNVGALLLTLFLVWELSGAAIGYLEAVGDTGTRVERSGRSRTLFGGPSWTWRGAANQRRFTVITWIWLCGC